ncbi:MAG: DUF4116 domain-containing protein [Alistipes senegalensis]|nr:DUF4116 domain-containing protein [Bacteroides cellulosilyticus]MCM1352955.1 DUF4116 domain-containing protein [Alistipes senegalensis]
MTEQEKQDIAFLDKGMQITDRPYGLLIDIPPERRTAKVCRHAVKLSARNLKQVPEALKTPRLCRTAVRRGGEALAFVPKERITPKLCRIAVGNYSYALASVPVPLRTRNLCMQAVRRNGWALADVPEKIKTPRMCREALKRLGSSDSDILAHIPFPKVCIEGIRKFEHGFHDPHRIFSTIDPAVLTEALALEGIRMSASCLTLLPQKFRTEKVCMAAIEKNGILLHAVPEHLRTKELCETAVLSNFRALDDVPHELKTPELCRKALEKTGDLRPLYHIPHREIHEHVLQTYCDSYTKTREFIGSMNPLYMTPQLAERVFLKWPELFVLLPEHCKDRELCETAVRHEGSYLRCVPETMKTWDLCMDAIRCSPYAIRYIPDEMKTPELYLRLVKENPYNLNGIPFEERTPQMCRIAFDNTYSKDKTDFSVISSLTDPVMVLQVMREQSDPKRIEFLMDILPVRLITSEIALEAVQKNGDVLHCVPQGAITPQIAEIAVRNEPRNIRWVPREMRTPDMCLCAEAAYPELQIYVPDEIAQGHNIYSFHRKVDETLHQPLGYDEYKRLYAGTPILVKDVQTRIGVLDCCEVRYDRKEKRLALRMITPKRENVSEKRKPTVKPSKKSKGRRM